MNRRRQLLMPVLVAITVPFLSACSTDDDSVRPYPTTPDQQSGNVAWIEEIRTGDGTTTLGYLEKHDMQHPNKPGKRYVYFVFDDNYSDVSKGFIIDTGRAFLHRRDGTLKDLGILGLAGGIKKILNHRGSLQFYRQGRQVFHN